MTFCLSPLTGQLCDRFGSRRVSIFGGLICCVGLILTSFPRKVNLFFLTYSLLFGLGSSCCRMSNFLTVSKYFLKRRSFANGIVTSGAGLGIFALSPLNQLLIDRLGLSSAYRLLGYVMLANVILALPFDPNVEEIAQRTQEIPEDNPETEIVPNDLHRCRNLIDISVWKVPVFAVSAVCGAVMVSVLSIPQFHLVSLYNFQKYL